MHIMLDLETMGLTPDSAILAIGAARFDREITGTFYGVVNLKSAQFTGGRIDASTVMWWMGEDISPEARKTLCGESAPIESVLKDFSSWVREKPLSGIWGNGAVMDNVILLETYRRLGWTPPWTYKEDRCYRTMAAMFPEIDKKQFDTGTHHNALDDAISQAKHLMAIFREGMFYADSSTDTNGQGDI